MKKNITNNSSINRYAENKIKEEKRIETGKRIEKCRKKRGYRKTDIAEYLEVDLSNVGRWERGEQSLTYMHLELLAKYLDTTVEYLMNGHSDDEANEITQMIMNLPDDLRESHKEYLKTTLKFIKKK